MPSLLLRSVERIWLSIDLRIVPIGFARLHCHSARIERKFFREANWLRES